MKKILFAFVAALAMCSCNVDNTTVIQFFNIADGSVSRTEVFEFDSEGALISPTSQLISFKKNDQLRIYTYDRHKDIYGDKGYMEEWSEVFYFDNENRLVKFESQPDNKEYFISYEDGVVKAVFSNVKCNYVVYTKEDDEFSMASSTKSESDFERQMFTTKYLTTPIMYESVYYAYCMADRLNMRQRSYAPDVNLNKEPVLQTITYGTCLQVLSDVDVNGWMQIRDTTTGLVGFVKTDYVVSEKDYLRFQSAATPMLLNQMTQSRDRIVLMKYLKRHGMIGMYANTYDSTWTKYFGDSKNYSVFPLTYVRVLNNNEKSWAWRYRYVINDSETKEISFSNKEDKFY